MKKGFTILELLVASLLLGMLVTILTMIFNQSSIAWRTGNALVTDLDDIRNDVALIREEADNVFVADNKPHLILGLWKEDGKTLRTRACDLDDGSSPSRITGLNDSSKPKDFAKESVSVQGSEGNGAALRSYVVNVMSAGPDRQFDTWDDIWSFPDDPNEW